MIPKRRLRLGDLDLAIIDPFESDIEFIYNEIFRDRTYHHPRFELPVGSTIIDVGANVGIFSIWAARTFGPRAIYSYEASPTTGSCLIDNVARNVDRRKTEVYCFNLAVSDAVGRELVLHQPPWNSGLSTMLDGRTLPWVEQLRERGELNSHKVTSTTLSHEIASRELKVVDLLKIDVEGHFMEVMSGLLPADMAKVRNIVLEAEYTDELGRSIDSICAMLRDRGFAVEAKVSGDTMIYAWRN